MERAFGARLDSIEDKLDKLIVTVRGDEEYGSRGIAPRLTDLERRVNRIETILRNVALLALGAGGLGSALAELIKIAIGN